MELLPTKRWGLGGWWWGWWGGLTVNHKHIAPLRWAELQLPAFGSSLPVIMMSLWPISVGFRFIYPALDCGLILGWTWHLPIHQPLKSSCDAVDTVSIFTTTQWLHVAVLLFTPFRWRVQPKNCEAALADVPVCIDATNLQSQRDALSLLEHCYCVCICRGESWQGLSVVGGQLCWWHWSTLLLTSWVIIENHAQGHLSCISRHCCDTNFKLRTCVWTGCLDVHVEKTWLLMYMGLFCFNGWFMAVDSNILGYSEPRAIQSNHCSIGFEWNFRSSKYLLNACRVFRM